MRLLLVEDDPELASRLAGRLRQARFAVDIAHNAADAEAWPDMDKLGAIVLDLGLPDGSGMDVLRTLRGRLVSCPIIILTARGSWQDKVAGLNAGADDFVVKPVRFEELLARLNAQVRRHAGRREGVLASGDIRLDPVAQIASQGDVPMQLSRMEYRLLHLFLRKPGQTLPQSDILEYLYELEEQRDQNAVEVLVSRLRRKIGRQRIATVRGLGYRFVP